MKKAFLTVLFAIGFFIATAAGSYACDFCILSQGISPLETLQGSGIRVNQRYALVNKVYEGDKKISLTPEPKEEYWTT